jgi:hypothetical protein
MALRTHVNIHAIDGKGKKTTFSYESLNPVPSDGNINSLVSAWKAITRLGVEKVTITFPLDGFAPIAPDDVGARLGDTAILQCHKGAEFGGMYTFRLAAIKEALLNADGTFIIASSEFASFAEWFDDGTGLFGLQGPFTVSDGEQLAENGSAPTLPSGLTAFSGRINGKRS